VFSAVAAKDIAGIQELLAPLAARIHPCPVDTPRATPTAELAAAMPVDAPPVTEHANFDEALQAALSSESPVLIAGSLFLVGEAKARLEGGTFQSSMQ
jgi:folylpolyglutamate synthase/dihydropteroate synthase